MGSISFGKISFEEILSIREKNLEESHVVLFLIEKGVSELMKESVEGWFKLLSQEEGDYYAVPIFLEGTNESEEIYKVTKKFS